jgi:hypothetical protein
MSRSLNKLPALYYAGSVFLSKQTSGLSWMNPAVLLSPPIYKNARVLLSFVVIVRKKSDHGHGANKIKSLCIELIFGFLQNSSSQSVAIKYLTQKSMCWYLSINNVLFLPFVESENCLFQKWICYWNNELIFLNRISTHFVYCTK